MNIIVKNKKCKLDKLRKDYPDAFILDVTSSSEDTVDTPEYGKLPACMLSPFFPHGGIPVPGMLPQETAACVEAVWQGLKVFEQAGVDYAMFKNDTMKNLKRTVRRFGPPRGHQYGDELIGYFAARVLIYLPAYKAMLENPQVQAILKTLKETSQKQDLVLLDYNTNTDFTDTAKPLSHAGLIKAYLEDRFDELTAPYANRTPAEIEAMHQEEEQKRPAQAKAKAPKRQKQSRTKASPKGRKAAKPADKQNRSFA